MTTIYFVQHGIAEPKVVNQDRPLSKEGIDTTQRIALLLRDKDIKINEVCHSGKLRTEQTAAIFAEILHVNKVTKLEDMNPNDDPSNLVGRITDLTMYVGHLPHIQKVVSLLVTGDQDNQALAFENSAVACVKIENQAYLKWYITPALC